MLSKLIKLIGVTLTMMTLTFATHIADQNNVVDTPSVRIVQPIELAETNGFELIEDQMQRVMEKRIERMEEVIEKVIEEPVEKELMSQEDIELIALVTMAEAEGEPEEGKRLVIDTILNRVDSDDPYYPDTVHGVVYQKNQFTSMWNGRVERCYVREDICELVREELRSRTNNKVMFFHAGKYGKYGTPMFAKGNHYFSSI